MKFLIFYANRTHTHTHTHIRVEKRKKVWKDMILHIISIICCYGATRQLSHGIMTYVSPGGNAGIQILPR